MSFDFVKVLEQTKITPLEKLVSELQEKVNFMADSFEKIVDLVLKMSDQFDDKVCELNNKITSLESKLNNVNRETITLETSPQNGPLPPPPNPTENRAPERKEIQPKSDRKALIDELKDLFKKRE